MLSIHSSENITLEKYFNKNNAIYDDTMHIVYSKKYKNKNLNMTRNFFLMELISISQKILK